MTGKARAMDDWQAAEGHQRAPEAGVTARCGQVFFFVRRPVVWDRSFNNNNSNRIHAVTSSGKQRCTDHGQGTTECASRTYKAQKGGATSLVGSFSFQGLRNDARVSLQQ